MSPSCRQKPAAVGPSVYCVRQGSDGPVKIGWAKDLRGRIRSLQSGNPVRLELVWRLPGGVAEEKALHLKFAEHRLLGEWFTSAPAVLEHAPPASEADLALVAVKYRREVVTAEVLAWRAKDEERAAIKAARRVAEEAKAATYVAERAREKAARQAAKTDLVATVGRVLPGRARPRNEYQAAPRSSPLFRLHGHRSEGAQRLADELWAERLAAKGIPLPSRRSA